jgi:flagellar hook protein FlgE
VFTFADGANAAGTASNPVGEGVHTTFVAYDSLGTPVNVDVTAVLESKSNAGNTWRFYAASGDDTDTSLVLGNGTLTFDNNGKLTASTGTSLTLDRNATGAVAPLAFDLDFSSMTSLTSRDSEMLMTVQDGSGIGTLNAFSVGADGTITGQFTNGLTRTLGQMAMATFSNPSGLEDKGGNQFAAGSNSGVAVISAPLDLGAGAIRAGALELSNVDLSTEFINLIISSTGFSAASRVITTSDQLITELLNSSR